MGYSVPVDNWVTLVLLVATLYLAQLRIRDAAAQNHFHIHLETLTGIGHLAVEVRDVSFFLFLLRIHPQLTYEQNRLSVGGYSRAFSSGTRTLTNPAQDIAAEYPGVASIPPPCVGLNGCEGAGTGQANSPQ